MLEADRDFQVGLDHLGPVKSSSHSEASQPREDPGLPRVRVFRGL